MEGVFKPSTWTEVDHRSTLTVSLYRIRVSGATDAALGDLIKNGTIRLDKVTTIELPRKAEWRGW
jgi:branched-chain amino acid transport system substrate-binding protein